MVVHDFGGPIGLGYAVNYPENVTQIIILNTWMWSLYDEKPFRQASALFGSAFGKFLYRKLNFSAKYLLPKAFYNRQLLTPDLHSQYTKALPDAASRTGTWRLAQELINSSQWFDSLRQKIERIQDKPILFIWGMKDALIPPHFLQEWQENFPKAQVVKLESGHFIQEEKPDELLTAVQELIE